MTSENSRIQYLSEPETVSMGNWWFDIATSDHFWIRRRFHVMQRIADSLIRNSHCCAEIGCGNGLLQRDIEDQYAISIAGFELNEIALSKNVSRRSPLYCYNIHHRNSRFREHFDLLFLFDVLEHIDDESSFLQSIRFHLANAGTLIINVPAHEFFRSNYDSAAGHVRRYSAGQLARVCERNGFKMLLFSYWGLPLVPLLLLRKAINKSGRGGFDPGGSAVNRLLAQVAKLEPVPQRLLGTSVMAVLEKQS